MHLRRTLITSTATLVSTGLVTAGLTLAAPTAQAATAPTRVVMTVDTKVHVGDSVSVSGQVQAQSSDGDWGYIPSDAGGVTLEKQTAGSSTWQAVATDDSGSSFYFSALKTTRTTRYRVTYAGGSSSGYDFPAADTSRTVKAFRDLNDKLKRPGNKILLVGKVSGGYAKSPVVVERRTAAKGKWRKFTTTRTNGKSRFSVRLGVPSRGTWYYRAYTPKSKGVEKSWSTYSYKTYRF